jgi:hypothetical protein
MTIQQRAEAFIKLGKKISENKINTKNSNPWFTPENVEFAIRQTIISLSEENINKWIKMYPETDEAKNKKIIGVISAGNIPLVGFHDFLSVLITGNFYTGKFSSKDNSLMTTLISLLLEIEPEFKKYIQIKEDKISDFDAVIATGSNNSARYFEYYFGKYPHIIRKNRNSVAIITGDETDDELDLLADDIFVYFGLGCRNVSKLFLPDNYNLHNIFKSSLKYSYIRNNNKYSNNYDYNRAIYMMNQINFFDNGFMILKEDIGISSPVSVVFYENYSKIETVKERLNIDSEKIQCLVTKKGIIENSIYFGNTQKPYLWDYADNVDTMKFLIDLNNG